MSNLFSFIDSINYSKKNLLDGENTDKEYVPFLVNKSLSYFSDTIMHSNEINRCSHIPKKYQYFYYLNSIRKRKRFSKWFKKDKNEDIDNIKKYYGISNIRAKEYLKLLNKDQLTAIAQSVSEGGLD